MVVEVVTVSVVEAPAASVALPLPLEAKTAAATCGTDESVSVAVLLALLTFVIRKTLEKVRAEGTVPRSIERPSTFPAATAVAVPGCTSVPGETEK
jgi:hypothetical protein